MESNYRSLFKAISYRVLGSAATALIVFLLSGKLGLSIGTGALDMVTKIGLYYLHERIWERISFGRAKPPEYEI
ncbi:MAG: DUF2061 domain-containing protein [Acidobacteriia bacterium]|nr:DUF2061 domain-containing protein [Terriglobia bacterium]